MITVFKGCLKTSFKYATSKTETSEQHRVLTKIYKPYTSKEIVMDISQFINLRITILSFLNEKYLKIRKR